MEIIPQKRKFFHFFWIFLHLNYEINIYFLINWILFRPNSKNYFQFYVGNISDYILKKINFFKIYLFKLSYYFRKNFGKIPYSVVYCKHRLRDNVGPKQRKQIQYENAGRKKTSLLLLYKDSKYFFSACFANNIF